ncbi:UNVERIFIED_CONTAM: hypothetical protein FKN15_063112 [Acipenser sinensis]
MFKGLARKDEQLTPSQRRLAVRKMPSLLEYFSYNCNFMGILVGPTSSYKDYIAFIEGTAYHVNYSETNGKENGKCKQSEPSPKVEVIHKLAVCAISLLVYLTVSKRFSVERNVDDAFIASTPFYTRVIYLYLSMLTTRPKYYFAWTLADAINNAAGFGFNGYKKDGTPRWDLVSNIRIANIESLLREMSLQPDSSNLLAVSDLARSVSRILPDVLNGDRNDENSTGSTLLVETAGPPTPRRSAGQCHQKGGRHYRSCYFCLHIICFLVITVLSLKPRQIRDKPTDNSLHQEHLQGGLVANNSHSATDNNSNQKRKAT